MFYQYKMLQVPPNITAKEDTGSEAAHYMQSVVNSQAREGWEFYRVDSIGVRVEPGCLAALLGTRASNVIYYVITFRRQA